MGKFKSLLISTLVLVGLLTPLFGSSVSAAPPAPAAATPAPACDNKATFFGIPAWYEYLPVKIDPSGNCSVVTDPNQTGNYIVLVLLAIVDILIRLAAIIAVVFVVWGGFTFVTSQGEPGKVASGRKTILNALIGLVIAILASQIVKFVAGFLSS